MKIRTKGLAMAIAKKFFDNNGFYYDIFKKWLPKEEDKDESNFFERELLFTGPLAACLEKAVEDEKEMQG